MPLSLASPLPVLPRQLLAGRELDLLLPMRLVMPVEAAKIAAAAPELDRRELAGILRDANRGWGHPGADELATALARPETLVVVTGQQPGLFGGPLYALTKAQAAVRWAERLERASGRRAVAVFWMASDDHDWTEIARACMPVRGSSEDGEETADWLVLDPARAGYHELHPVGPHRLGAQVEELLSARAGLAASPRYRQWLERLATIYTADETFTGAFARLVVELLGADGPLLLDPTSPGIKRLQAPLLAPLLEPTVAAALAERDVEMERRGLPLQVRSQPDCPPLFALDDEGARRRLRCCGNGFELRGGYTVGTRETVLAEIERQPERFSPSALARPAVQDQLLGTALFLVGPGELSYLAQASSIYRALGIAGPALALRPQTAWVDPRRRQQLEDLAARGLGLDLLLAASDQTLESALAAAADADDPVAEGCRQVLAAAAGLRERALAVDCQLESACEKTVANIEKALETLQRRACAARARSDHELRQRVMSLRQFLRPNGAPQERVIACAHMAGLFGEGAVAAVSGQLELEPGILQLVDPCASPDQEAMVATSADGDGTGAS